MRWPAGYLGGDKKATPREALATAIAAAKDGGGGGSKALGPIVDRLKKERGRGTTPK